MWTRRMAVPSRSVRRSRRTWIASQLPTVRAQRHGHKSSATVSPMPTALRVNRASDQLLDLEPAEPWKPSECPPEVTPVSTAAVNDADERRSANHDQPLPPALRAFALVVRETVTRTHLPPVPPIALTRNLEREVVTGSVHALRSDKRASPTMSFRGFPPSWRCQIVGSIYPVVR